LTYDIEFQRKDLYLFTLLLESHRPILYLYVREIRHPKACHFAITIKAILHQMNGCDACNDQIYQISEARKAILPFAMRSVISQHEDG
jgi:hypothetical protein